MLMRLVAIPVAAFTVVATIVSAYGVIANRTLTFSGRGKTSPPVSLTITWPN
jgi:hypothetical protein